MTKEQFGKFNKLYQYLNNLESKKFTLKSFVDGNINDLGKRRPFHYTRACVSGYLPIVFPKDWQFVEDIIPLLVVDTTELYSKDMALYFGLDEIEVLQLTVAKNYRRPNLNSVLGRMRILCKTYGYILGSRT